MLTDFPNEIQCQIIRLLDPVGLISVSQSSRHFRRLVNPQKRHLVERLLQVELSAEHGGPTLTYRSRDSRLEPSWQDAAWESMRWACTSCLRLLSNKFFDNQSLLRLSYRKPLPNSDAAQMITTWEPRPNWRPQDRLAPGSEAYQLEKSRRRIYSFAVTKGVMCDVEGHPAEHLDILDVTVLAGFEKLFEKEFRDMDDDEQLELFDKIALLIENDDCADARSGKRYDLFALKDTVRDGDKLFHHLNTQYYTPVYHLPQAEAEEWGVLLQQTPRVILGLTSGLSREDLDLINTRRRQWKDLLDRAKKSDAENPQYQVLDNLYDKWIRRSDAIEEKWKSLMFCREEIKDNPELLADWAFGRDGAAFT
ncbi:hypothetical protein FPRO06_09881 [Fusarium proliferatum]|nr:hypothetical protein FPRO06_09881 [Fusarium proliferatum]